MANLRVIKASIVDGIVSSNTIGYIEESTRISFETFHPFNEESFLAGGSNYYLLDTNYTEEGLSLITNLENPEG